MEEELQKLGLNEHEAKVYLAALSLGAASANQLANITEIKRPTVYLALENLVKKGIVFETFVEKKRLFQAEKPEKLDKLTKRMRRKTVEAELLLESIMPGLIKLPKIYNEEPQVTFYFGFEGMKNVMLDVAACKTSWYFFGSGTKILEKLKSLKRLDVLEDSWELRSGQNRPKIYLISDSGVFALGKGWEKTKTPWREMKILPTIINSGSAFIIYEDKLVVLSLENKPFVAVIKSKEAVEVVKVMYRLIWKSLPD